MSIMMDYKIQPLAVVENLRTYTKTHTLIHKKKLSAALNSKRK